MGTAPPQRSPCPLTTALSLQLPSPFCHPERSRPVPACRGGICGSADLSWKCFSRHPVSPRPSSENETTHHSEIVLCPTFSRCASLTLRDNATLKSSTFFSSNIGDDTPFGVLILK